MAVKNKAVSVLARLKNQSKEAGIPFQMLLQLFAQEEFLRRLSLSEYRDNLILKGGMFIYVLTEFKSRPTRDIDFLVRSLHGSLGNIEQVMRNICNCDAGNGFLIIPFSIDIGIDDVIVPEPVERKVVPRLPDFWPPVIYTYSLESTIAEKFDAILQRMSGTSRMKDFYDIYYLSGIFDFRGQVLSRAVNATLRHRERELPEDAFDEMDAFKRNEFLGIQWRAYEPAKHAGLIFEDVIDRLHVFLEPIYMSILEGTEFGRCWDCGSRTWV